MNKRLGTLLLLGICLMAVAEAFAYPQIDSRGAVQLNLFDQNLDDTSLTQIMQEFSTLYSPDDVKDLTINLGMNKIQSLSGLSVLKAYQRLERLELDLVANQELVDAVCLIDILRYNYQLVSFDIDLGIDYLVDLEQFTQELSKLSQIQDLSVEFGHSLIRSQGSYDQIMLSLLSMKNLRKLTLNLDSNPRITRNDIWVHVRNLHLLTELNVNLMGAKIQDQNTFFENVAHLEGLRKLTYLNYAKPGQPWQTNLEKMHSLEDLKIWMNIQDQNEVDNYLKSISQLRNLQNLHIKLISPGVINLKQLNTFQRLTQLKSLTMYIDTFAADFTGLEALSGAEGLISMDLDLQQMGCLQEMKIPNFARGFHNLRTLSLNSNCLVSEHQLQNIYYLKKLEILNLDFSNLFNSVSFTTTDFLNGIEKMEELRVLQIKLERNADLSEIKSLARLKHLEKFEEVSINIREDNNIRDIAELGDFSHIKNIKSIQLFMPDRADYTFLENYNQNPSLKDLFIDQNYCDMRHHFIQSDESSYECLSCHPKCGKCFGPDQNQCLTCLHSFMYEHECVDNCPAGYHPNPQTNQCEKNRTETY